MSIPDYQTIMLPLLEYLKDNKERSIREAIDSISNKFSLTDDEKKELLPSGKQAIIDNRVGWARTYMKKAGLLIDPKRGFTKITKSGIDVLNEKPEKINISFLERFPGFVEFRTIKRESDLIDVEKIIEQEEAENQTPDELMESGYKTINSSLAQELLDKLRKNPPEFFEKVVLELLVALGYGEGKVTGKSGDGGVDGIVNQDKLGLEKIYFQAKRFNENNSVTASMVRDFVGTLTLNNVNKGVFITTSRFPNNSEEDISRSNKNIILVDGRMLVGLMIENDLGVTTEKIYKIRKIDSDYFIEE